MFTITNIIESIGVHEAAASPYSITDHSALVMEIVTYDVNVFEPVHNSNTSTSMNGHRVASASNIRPPRFKVTGVHNNFLNSEESRNKLLSIIEDIEKSRNTQEDIDRIYDELYYTYIQEMGIYYRKLDDTPFSKRNHSFTYKEWWDKEVATAWRDMKNAE